MYKWQQTKYCKRGRLWKQTGPLRRQHQNYIKLKCNFDRREKKEEALLKVQAGALWQGQRRL